MVLLLIHIVSHKYEVLEFMVRSRASIGQEIAGYRNTRYLYSKLIDDGNCCINV
jgi:hypothetical protein